MVEHTRTNDQAQREEVILRGCGVIGSTVARQVEVRTLLSSTNKESWSNQYYPFRKRTVGEFEQFEKENGSILVIEGWGFLHDTDKLIHQDALRKRL